MHLEEQMSYAKQQRRASRERRLHWHEQPADGSLSIVERQRQLELARTAAENYETRKLQDQLAEVGDSTTSLTGRALNIIGRSLLAISEKHNDFARTQHYKTHKGQY